MMIARKLVGPLRQALGEFPAVALLGPRQCGKTTLALEIAAERDAVYLDLESEADRFKLAEPELYLSDHLEQLVILDEVHRVPGLFPVLRGRIDVARRRGRRAGQYLLLGSASPDLLKQSSESLAGRIAFLELTPFTALEVDAGAMDDLWLRGGFPLSLLAPDAKQSFRWRSNFIRTYLERDVPQFAPRIAAETLRRFWVMLAHGHGTLLNAAQLARNLSVSAKTIASYLDLLVDLLLVRRLPPWHANLGKRLVRSPKVYLRDSGVLHTLLGIEDKEALLSHPVLGASWEGHVIESLLASAPDGVQGHFYRTSAGAEIDLLLGWPDGRKWAVEIKRSLAPRPERGFHFACADLKPERRFIVYPGTESFAVGSDVEAVSLRELAQRVAAAGGSRETVR